MQVSLTLWRHCRLRCN